AIPHRVTVKNLNGLLHGLDPYDRASLACQPVPPDADVPSWWGVSSATQSGCVPTSTGRSSRSSTSNRNCHCWTASRSSTTTGSGPVGTEPASSPWPPQAPDAATTLTAASASSRRPLDPNVPGSCGLIADPVAPRTQVRNRQPLTGIRPVNVFMVTPAPPLELVRRSRYPNRSPPSPRG